MIFHIYYLKLRCIAILLYILVHWALQLVKMVKVSTNGRRDLGSISMSKMELVASLLYTVYKESIKGKWSNPGKGSLPSPTSRCISYWNI